MIVVHKIIKCPWCNRDVTNPKEPDLAPSGHPRWCRLSDVAPCVECGAALGHETTCSKFRRDFS